jgi:peptidoglycan/LPS O-acetylase OafA/YrhL
VGWIRFVGVLSYGIYLMHPTILFMVHEWTAWNAFMQGALALGLTLACAALVYRFIERPCARLRKKLSRVIEPAPKLAT